MSIELLFSYYRRTRLDFLYNSVNLFLQIGIDKADNVLHEMFNWVIQVIKVNYLFYVSSAIEKRKKW